MLEKFKRLMKYWEIGVLLILFVVIYFIVKKFFLGIALEANSYYYTLSTLVQGLSSLVGIIFVVLIFHFQNIGNQRIQLIDFIKNFTEGLGIDYQNDIDLFDDKKLLTYCNSLKEKIKTLESTPTVISLNNNTNLLEKILENKKIFIDNLIIPATASFSAIIFGLIGLAFKSLISMEGQWNILFINVSLTILAVYEIIVFIRKSLLSK